MKNQQSLGGGARGFIPLKGKNVGVKNQCKPSPKFLSSLSFAKKFHPLPFWEREEGVGERKASLTPVGEGFTLAEVLITLGIIGVVAAMTMPTLIKNYQKKQTATQMRKTYAVLENALTMARAEHGELKEWEGPKGYIKDGNYDGIEAFAKKYILPYIKYTKTCKGCEDYEITLLNGNSLLAQDNPALAGKAPYQIFMPDGTILSLYTRQQERSDDPTIMWKVKVAFDINGKKKPNVISKDVAQIEMREELNNYFLYGSEYTYDEQTDSSFPEACTKSTTGRRCLNLLRMDNWDIKDHYPW